MPKKPTKKRRTPKLKKRHRFFLNPYEQYAFTKCPKCETKTRIRKFPLVIHIEPRQLFLLNKQCRYCTYCDLIIVKQGDVEALMAASLSQSAPDIVGNEYLVMGTLERSDWRSGNKGELAPHEVVERMYVFKDVWNFEVSPGGWYPPNER